MNSGFYFILFTKSFSAKALHFLRNFKAQPTELDEHGNEIPPDSEFTKDTNAMTMFDEEENFGTMKYMDKLVFTSFYIIFFKKKKPLFFV